MIFLESGEDHLNWVLLPPTWPNERARRAFAKAVAQGMWELSGLEWGRRERRALAGVVEDFAANLPGTVEADRYFLYVDDPRLVPLPFWAVVVPSEGEADETLRTVAQAHLPSPVRETEVEEISGRIGAGVRGLRYRDSGEGTLMVTLTYAWRSEEFGRDVMLRTVCHDPARLASRLDELDAVVAQLWLNPAPEQAAPGASG
ncbi:hypothetical protein ABZ114_10285 [Streptomyces albidoflavus]|uniref:hypothetical protein n=1 Tax=Streptomyces albidoflavus TaxID=1886 RepID=UPI0033B2CB96